MIYVPEFEPYASVMAGVATAMYSDGSCVMRIPSGRYQAFAPDGRGIPTNPDATFDTYVFPTAEDAARALAAAGYGPAREELR